MTPAAAEVDLTTSSAASLTDAFVHSALLASPSRLHANHNVILLLLVGWLAVWHSGRTSVFDRRTFPVLRSTCLTNANQ